MSGEASSAEMGADAKIARGESAVEAARMAAAGWTAPMAPIELSDTSQADGPESHPATVVEAGTEESSEHSRQRMTPPTPPEIRALRIVQDLDLGRDSIPLSQPSQPCAAE
eukprot:9845038-Alexandrium_andersonii.AAC.1